MERVLIVEDHHRLANSIADGLRDQGYAADIAYDGEEGTRLAKTEPYDVILLDLMLPRKDGYAVLKTLRDGGLKTPVLCLTARDALDDKVRGLDGGADDYLVKPFDWAELLARTRVLIRRGHGQSHGAIEIADLKIDTVGKLVERAGQRITLTAREYALLEFMAYRQNRVLSRTDIWDHLYDRNEENGSNVVDVYIGYLRNKIDKDHDVKLIHTRRGMGYVLSDES
ncbi:MAG: two component transcriptional regulator, winged helix family [Phycisphaerales bacterium]|nr:two component transcriptional regulator, winged helix family [Phycisphaerales bacterium]